MNVPEGTQSLALIVDDPDAPNGVFQLEPAIEGQMPVTVELVGTYKR